MALQNFLKNKKLPGNILELVVLKEIDKYSYVVGDSSGLTLLSVSSNPSHAKEIKIGATLKLLKPIVIDNKTLETNKNFKPLKSKKDIILTPSVEDLAKFETMTNDIKVDSKLKTFKSVKENHSQTNISSLTVMITNVSRIIETKTGSYQISGMMDVEGQKASINLYEKNIDKLEVGSIYTLTKIKKTIIRKDGKHEMRLATTKFTTISEAIEDNKLQFGNISLGESQMEGKILGFSEINIYNSCDKHWSKLDDEDICPKCEGPAMKIKVDFHTELYIQDSTSDEMKSFLIFKRQIIKMINETDEKDLIEKRLADLEGLDCTIEYDEPENEETSIIPKRLKLDETG